jgi:mRNA interferase MazF
VSNYSGRFIYVCVFLIFVKFLTMTITNHPCPGTIVRVDLSEGFRKPEMVKRRPCVILSPRLPGRDMLCTIVPLSTSKPNVIKPYHMQIAFNPLLPYPYDAPIMWLKGDIVLTVAFHRLRLLFSHREGGQRVYDARVLEADIFEQIRQCVRAGLGL